MIASKRTLPMKRALAASAIAVTAIVVGAIAGPASAQDVEIQGENVTIFNETEGSVHELGSAAVDADLVGLSCNIVATITNQVSVHAGNKLVVTSGDSTVEIEGIEDTADSAVTKGGSLTLADTITVSVMLGPDGASSLGSALTVTCEKPVEAPAPKPIVKDPTYTG